MGIRAEHQELMSPPNLFLGKKRIGKLSSAEIWCLSVPFAAAKRHLQLVSVVTVFYSFDIPSGFGLYILH